MRKNTIVILCLAVFFIGCTTTRIADLTVVSTKIVDLSKITPEQLRSGVNAKGEDIVIFGISNMETAIDRALEKGGGDVMINAVLSVYSGFFDQGWVVEGKVINSNGGQGK